MSRQSVERTISRLPDDTRRLMGLLEELGRHSSLRDPLVGRVEALHLTPPQIHAIMWTGRDGGLTMGALAQRLGVTEKTITGIVDRLERAQYVRRERDGSDRRVVKVVLTDAGRATWKELYQEIADKLGAFLSLLESEDRDALFRILERLLEKLLPAQAGRAAPSQRTP